MSLGTSFKNVMNVLSVFGKKHSTAITITLVTGGVLGTGVFSSVAAVKTVKDVEKKETELGRKLTKKEIVKCGVKHYIAPVSIGAATIATAAGAKVEDAKTIMGLSGALDISENIVKSYESAAEHVLPEKTIDELQKSVIDQHLKEPAANVKTEEAKNYILSTKDKGILIREDWTQHMFRGSWNQINDAFNQLNAMMINENEVSINDVYSMFNLRLSPDMYYVGWNQNTSGLKNGLIPFDTKPGDGGEEYDHEPCIVIHSGICHPTSLR